MVSTSAMRRLRAVFLRPLHSRSRRLQQTKNATRHAQTRVFAGYGAFSGKEPDREQRERKRSQKARKRALSEGRRSRGNRPKPRQHWRCGQKKTQPIRVGFSSIGGGAAPRTKRLFKVRNRSAAGCCELVRTGSKRLPVRPSVVDDQAGFSPRLVTGKSVQPRMLFEVSSIPETGIEPASVATANNTPNYTHSWAR